MILLFPSFLMGETFLNQKWYLSAAHFPQDIGIENPPYISISREKGIYQISGFDGCNFFMGKLKKGKSLIIGSQFAGTMMACPDGAMNSLSTWLLGFLKNGTILYKKSPYPRLLIKKNGFEVFFLSENPNSPQT